MYSVGFPKMFDEGGTILVKDIDAIKQNIKLLLTSEKMELFCDPYYGTNIKRMLYQKGSALKDILIDDIVVAVNTFMPTVTITHKDVEVYTDKTNVYCNIYGVYNNGVASDVLDINLTEFENER